MHIASVCVHVASLCMHIASVCVHVASLCVHVASLCVHVASLCVHVAPSLHPSPSWSSCSLSQWKCRRRVLRHCTTSYPTPGTYVRHYACVVVCCILNKLWVSQWQCLSSLPSRASKVFTNHQMAQQSGCIPCFAEVGYALGITL